MTTAYFRAKYSVQPSGPGRRRPQRPAERRDSRSRSGRLEHARKGFIAIPSGTEFSLRSKYFVGTIHTSVASTSTPSPRSSASSAKSPRTTRSARVVELTYLALGRLYYETEQLEQALEAYRAIEQTSSHFGQALYELAWTYIRLGDAIQAERALEVLSVAAPDSPLNADGKVLRGDLLARTAATTKPRWCSTRSATPSGPFVTSSPQSARASGSSRVLSRSCARKPRSFRH